MPGMNVRRRVRLDGGNDDKNGRTLLEGAGWMAFRAGGQKVEVQTFRYPVSRFGYLRVRLGPDRGLREDKLALQPATLRRSIRVLAEDPTPPANPGPREPAPADGGPGSARLIDFGGDRLPCEKRSFDVRGDAFARPYRLEVAEADDPTPATPAAPRQAAVRPTWGCRCPSLWPDHAGRRGRLGRTPFATGSASSSVPPGYRRRACPPTR